MKHQNRIFYRLASSQPTRRFFKRRWVPSGALALILPMLHGCPTKAQSVDILSAAVEPAVIPAPTAQTPSAFSLRFRSTGDGHHMEVFLGDVPREAPTESRLDPIDTTVCNAVDCRDSDVVTACTSSVNTSDSSKRDLMCSDRAKPQTRSPGQYVMRFRAVTTGGLGYSNDQDHRDVAVTIQ